MQDRETRRRAAKRAAIALSVLLLILAAVYIIVQLYAILGRTYRTLQGIGLRLFGQVVLVDGLQRLGSRARRRLGIWPVEARMARDAVEPHLFHSGQGIWRLGVP